MTEVNSLGADFERVIDLCAELENATVPLRVKQRIAAAYTHAVEKAIVLAWYEVTDMERVNRTLFRHAERGAREFLP